MTIKPEYIIIVTVFLSALIILLAIGQGIDYYTSENEINKRINIIHNRFSLSGNKKEREIRKGEKKEKIKVEKVKKKENAFQKIYNQYIFFGGKKETFFSLIVVGYLVAVLVYYFISKNILVGLILGVLYLVALYMISNQKLKKKRIKYLKSFANSIDVLNSGFSAGNTFEEAITNVYTRKNVDTKLRQEFTLLSNNLKSGMYLTEAINKMVERNSMFEEFIMFGIAVELYDKSGGRSLNKIFSDLQVTVLQKIENYSEIDGKISSYQGMFKIFVIVQILATLLIPLFLSNFYEVVNSSPMNILKLLVAVVMTLVGTVFLESSISSAAEG